MSEKIKKNMNMIRCLDVGPIYRPQNNSLRTKLRLFEAANPGYICQCVSCIHHLFTSKANRGY